MINLYPLSKLIPVLLSVVMVVTAQLAYCASPQANADQKQAPFVCDPSALTKEQRAILKKVGPELLAAKRTTKELPNGYEITFKDGKKMLPIVAKWIPLETLCCPCFDFNISASGRGGPLVVRLTGADGIKEFINAELPNLATLTGSKHK